MNRSKFNMKEGSNEQPKYVVARVVGFLKGKSAIQIARVFSGRRRNSSGEHFWARGFYVSTVGKDEQAVRKYIKEQEAADRQFDPLKLTSSRPLLGGHGSVPRNRFERFTIQASGSAGGI